jgi:hypothetical protein
MLCVRFAIGSASLFWCAGAGAVITPDKRGSSAVWRVQFCAAVILCDPEMVCDFLCVFHDPPTAIPVLMGKSYHGSYFSSSGSTDAPGIVERLQ